MTSRQSSTARYEVALSFATEERTYVAAVAAYLRQQGVTVFYDADEQAALWGEDLYVHLDRIYRQASQYCVMFVSKAYARKLWTNHERMSLQARDFLNAHDGTVLPARFDDTEIPGLRPQIGYIDLRVCTPRELALQIAEKVRGKRRVALARTLERALTLADDYLAPQPLATADAVAQEIRRAFASTGYVPDLALLEPYIRSELPAERVVGYLAYQASPFMGPGELWRPALEAELEYATTSRETRPLWQLLVCIALFGAVTTPEEMQFVDLPLDHTRRSLATTAGVDDGGQCRAKIDAIIAVFPWMSGAGSYTSVRAEWLWEFVWATGERTIGLVSALRYVRDHPDVARGHIEAGHFLGWYGINVPPDASVPDLMAAIANQIGKAEVS